MKKFKYNCETIWDHNPTEEELEAMGYNIPVFGKYKLESDKTDTTPDYFGLCTFFKDRGQDDEIERLFMQAQREGYDDLFTLQHEVLGGGCIHLEDLDDED